MTVTSINLIKEGSGGTSSGVSDSSIDRAYRVITNDPDETPAELQAQFTVQRGDPMRATGVGAYFLAKSIDWDFTEKGPTQAVWIATVSFETTAIDEEELEREQKPNPLDRRARITVRSARYGELTIRDRDGNVKRTSAGEIYREREKDATRWLISVRKNYTDIPEFIWTYQNKVNDNKVTVKGRELDAETVKFGEVMVPEIQIENGISHIPIEFELEYRRNGWADERVDAGFYYLSGTDLKPILDADGEPVTVEEWLDGSGSPLRDTISNPSPGDESFNTFYDYETADFSILPLNEG